jgi:hypothetical protein
MKTLSRQQQQHLQQVFGPRVALDRLERMFYSHDVGSLPSLVKPLVGSTMRTASPWCRAASPPPATVG